MMRKKIILNVLLIFFNVQSILAPSGRRNVVPVTSSFISSFTSGLGFASALALVAVVGFPVLGALREKVSKATIRPMAVDRTMSINRFGDPAQEYLEIIGKCYQDGINTLEEQKRFEEALRLGKKNFMERPSSKTLVVPVGALLYGPSGSGKTLFSQAVAKTGVPVFLASEITSKYVGEDAVRLRKVFATARGYLEQHPETPFVGIYFDEVERVIGKRLEATDASDLHHNNLVHEFLLSTSQTGELSRRIFIMASTNNYNNLDPAAMRSGRFTRKIEFLPASEQAGRKILYTAFAQCGKLLDSDLVAFLKETNGSFLGSAADAGVIPRVAFEHALLENSPTITLDHFQKALRAVRFGNAE